MPSFFKELLDECMPALVDSLAHPTLNFKTCIFSLLPGHRVHLARLDVLFSAVFQLSGRVGISAFKIYDEARSREFRLGNWPGCRPT